MVLNVNIDTQASMPENFRSEYDIIPHDSKCREDHQLIFVVFDAPDSRRVKDVCHNVFAICSCTIKLICKPILISNRPSECSLDQVNYLLLITPNSTSLWNRRRSLIVDSIPLSASRIVSELHFNRLVLEHSPRSNESLSFRLWLIKYVKENDHDSSVINLDAELKLCDLLADKHRMHYCLWQYRRDLVLLLLHPIPSLQFLSNEFDRVNDWLMHHPTDTSGWTYLVHLLTPPINHDNCDVRVGDNSTKCLSNQSQPPQSIDQSNVSDLVNQLIGSQFELVKQILQLYPERESVWCARRSLFALLATRMVNTTADSPPIGANEDQRQKILAYLCKIEPLLAAAAGLKPTSTYTINNNSDGHLRINHHDPIARTSQTEKASRPPVKDINESWPDLMERRYLAWLSHQCNRMGLV